MQNVPEGLLPRPAKWRCLECLPGTRLFGPAGVPARNLESLRLAFDELEALRLLHLEGMTQANAGKRLGVSGSTVSRMAERAHRVITEALVLEKGICVEGGPVTVVLVAESSVAASMPGAGQAGLSSGAEQAEGSSNEGETMIVAVPFLNGDVNAHFGSTRAFLIADTADRKIERTSLFELQGMQHNHAGIAGFLKEQRVEVILAGGMGAPMQQALKMHGFKLYCGVSGPATEAIEAFLRGDIEQSESTCGHHHGEH
ncbi:MAG: DUF134 domain-containing protein [Actinobacteria bacterium]|nr:DUF134 domain-containing protein [Actinomycetota bacterium]